MDWTTREQRKRMMHEDSEDMKSILKDGRWFWLLAGIIGLIAFLVKPVFNPPVMVLAALVGVFAFMYGTLKQ